MKALGIVLLALLMSAILSAGFARPAVEHTVRGTVRLDDADPAATFSLMEHRMGAVRTTLSNYGVWGNPNATSGYHGWEWPINSGNNFLFSAGVWVGAEIGAGHRVSTTTDGDNGTEEFWPEHIGTHPPQNPSADWWVQSCCLTQYRGRLYERLDSIRAYEEFYAAFQDSISPVFVRSMDPDGHVPLSVHIAQRTHVWPGYIARDIIFVDYLIHNMGLDPLHHVYLALFADPDIGAAGETGDNASAHDGNFYDDTRLMAVQGKYNFWRGAPTPGLWAMKVTGAPVPLDQLRITFRNFARLTGGDPPVDEDKYSLMSSGNSSDTSSHVDDWRMLLCFGPAATNGFELAPDSTLYISVAFLSGANLDSLDVNAARAQALFDSGYNYHPPAPAENFHVVSSTSGTVTLAWSPPSIGTFIGYNLFGRDSAGAGQQEQFNTALITDTTFTVTGLQNGTDWLFQLETRDTSGQGSVYAEVLSRVGAALPVTGLSGHTEQGAVTLNWNPSSEPNVTGYRVTRTTRLTSGVVDTALFATTAPAYQDNTPRRGYDNIYRVQAVNDLGIYSFYSDSVDLVPWAPQSRILVMDETAPGTPAAGAIPADSATALYQRLMTAIGQPFDYCREPGCGTTDSLARYDLVIWCNENRATSSNDTREDALRRYVAAGGRLLRISREFCAGTLHLAEGINRATATWASLAPLQLDSVYASMYHVNRPGMQFSGATSAHSGFPSFALDTARVHFIRFGTNRYDYLPEVDLLWPTGNTSVLYRTVVLSTDSSGFSNQPCGVIGPGEIVLTFPLYFLHESDAQTILSACIDTLRSMNLDVPTPPPAPLPRSTVLHPSYPNPFNPVTTLRFDLSAMRHVRLAIYNMLGQQVAVLMDGMMPAGAHELTWNAGEYSSGLYFAVLEAGEVRQTQKLILLK
ncbi:MAG TPA: fibronectin type III domain-containing protein [bacterium]|jgi:hypothetical protein